jgi:hypothetical protein
VPMHGKRSAALLSARAMAPYFLKLGRSLLVRPRGRSTAIKQNKSAPDCESDQ